MEQLAVETGLPLTANLLDVIQANKSSPPVMATRLDTRIANKHEQFDLWRSSTASLGEVERRDAPHQPFQASMTNYLTSSLGFARHKIANPCCFRRSQTHIGREGEDMMVVQLRVTGVEVDSSFEDTPWFAPGVLRLFDLEQPFMSENRSYGNVAVLVPKRLLQDQFPRLEAFHGQNMPQNAMTRLLADHMRSVIDAMPQVSQQQAEQIAASTLELVRASLGCVLVPQMAQSESLQRPALQMVRHYISEHLDDPALCPDYIACAMGMSRATLFRLCKPHGGPMEMVRAQRLAQAKKLLRRPGMTVSLAASMVGYESREAFSRAFRREFEMSAKEYQYACAPGVGR